MTIWIPGNAMWVFRAFESLIQHFERKGIPKSRNELALAAIQASLKAAYAHDPNLRAEAEYVFEEE